MCKRDASVCAGHQEPEALPSAQESRAGEAAADQHRPELKDQLLQHADRLLQSVHQNLHGQPGQQGQVSEPQDILRLLPDGILLFLSL